MSASAPPTDWKIVRQVLAWRNAIMAAGRPLTMETSRNRWLLHGPFHTKDGAVDVVDELNDGQSSPCLRLPDVACGAPNGDLSACRKIRRDLPHSMPAERLRYARANS